MAIFVDGEPKSFPPFFLIRDKDRKLKSANALAIYGLSAGGVSRFRNLKMCDTICGDTPTEYAEKLIKYDSAYDSLL